LLNTLLNEPVESQDNSWNSWPALVPRYFGYPTIKAHISR
jgi:hypothetical protein